MHCVIVQKHELKEKERERDTAVDAEVTMSFTKRTSYFDVEYSHLSVTYQTQLKSLDVDDPRQQVGEWCPGRCC